MRRAERKLKLSQSVIGEDREPKSTQKDIPVEAGDMRSLIFGLHVFDPIDPNPNLSSCSNLNMLNEERITKLDEMTDRIVDMRNRDLLSEAVHAFEINQTDIKRTSEKIDLDLGLDEAAYRSWVEKFKEASASVGSVNLEMERRKGSSTAEEREARREIERRRKEDNKLARWETVGYKSLTVEEPENILEESVGGGYWMCAVCVWRLHRSL